MFKIQFNFIEVVLHIPYQKVAVLLQCMNAKYFFSGCLGFDTSAWRRTLVLGFEE